MKTTCFYGEGVKKKEAEHICVESLNVANYLYNMSYSMSLLIQIWHS